MSLKVQHSMWNALLDQKPFTALLLQKPVHTFEATEHGLHQPGVELVYHVYPLNKKQVSPPETGGTGAMWEEV